MIVCQRSDSSRTDVYCVEDETSRDVYCYLISQLQILLQVETKNEEHTPHLQAPSAHPHVEQVHPAVPQPGMMKICCLVGGVGKCKELLLLEE
jgi:hypothetical protein